MSRAPQDPDPLRPAPQGPPAPDAPALRGRVLAAATRLFAERGYAGTSLREVALAVGVTKPAIYHHFPSKEALFLEALGACATALGARLAEAFDAGGPARERMLRGVRALLDHVRADPSGMLVLYRASQSPEEGQPDFDFDQVDQVPLAIARSMLEEGVRRGELRADVDLEDALLALQGLVDRRCCTFILGGAPIDDDFPRRAVTLLFDGIGAKT